MSTFDELSACKLEQSSPMRGSPVKAIQQQVQTTIIVPIKEYRALVRDEPIGRDGVARIWSPRRGGAQHGLRQSPGRRHVLEVRNAQIVDALIDEQVSAGVQIDQAVQVEIHGLRAFRLVAVRVCRVRRYS